jgi:hypothetical protein
VIREFESQPSLHTNSLAFSEYIKALAKVDGVGESESLKTLQRGDYLTRIAHFLLILQACILTRKFVITLFVNHKL